MRVDQSVSVDFHVPSVEVGSNFGDTTCIVPTSMKILIVLFLNDLC